MKNLKKLTRNELKKVNGGNAAQVCSGSSCANSVCGGAGDGCYCKDILGDGTFMRCTL